MADKTVRGRFVWHELMTPESAASQAFYTKVLGWKTQAWEADPSYSMFAAGSGPLGGVVAESAEQSHWVPYVGSADLESTVREARELGASVVTDITPIGGGGRYAVLRDPQGAKFGVYASDAPAQKEKAPQRGEFSWHELATTDAPAALDFYTKLFGWEQLDKHDMGALGFYYIFGRNGTPVGGAFNLMAGMPGGPAWTGYVRVKDLDKVVKRVKSGGGTLINGPMEVPGGDWIAQFMDPHGALFAAHVLKADRESAAAQPAVSAAAAEAPAAAAPAEKAAPAAKPAKPAAASKPAAARKPAAKKAKTKAASAKKPAKKAPAKKKAGKKAAKRAAAKAAKRGTRKSAKARGKAARKTQKRPAVKKKAVKARKKARRAK